MPYDNEYNRMVAEDIKKLNEKYVAHDKKIGEGMSGGFLGSLAGMLLPTVISGVSSLFGNGMSGGVIDEIPAADAVIASASKSSIDGGAMPKMSGYAQGTFRDRGDGFTIGAVGSGKSGGVAVYKKRGRPKKMVGGTELGLPPPVLSNRVGGGRSGAGRSGAGRSGAGRSGAGRSGAGRSGAGRSGAGMSGGRELTPVGNMMASSMAGGAINVQEKKEEMKKMLSKMGKGRSGAGRSGAGKSGAGVSGGFIRFDGLLNPLMAKAGEMIEKVREKRKKEKKEGKGRSGAGMSGGMDGRKKRAEIVKRIMNEKGLKMIEASKYIKEHNLY